VDQILYTIGHSTHPLDEFIAILKSHHVEAIADVRRFPGSRRHPHFNALALKESLPAQGIDYAPFVELGGRRQPRPDSPNSAWRNAAFRGYADYMQTSPFSLAIDQLEKLAARKATAVMCAETLPWRCHRSLIADAMLVRGWIILDIFDQKPPKPHELPAFAVVKGREVLYPK
jgi:uncharacterized protein (DUF488 family)